MADGTVMSDVKLSSIPVKISFFLHTYIFMHLYRANHLFFTFSDRRVHAQPDEAIEYGAEINNAYIIHTHALIYT